MSHLSRSPVRAFGGELCFWCDRELLPTGFQISDGKSHPLSGTRDHRIPRSQGGPNHPDNLVLACYECNTNRGIIPEEEWINSPILKEIKMKIDPLDSDVIRHRVEIHEGVRKSFQEITCTVPECSHTMRTPVSVSMKPASVVMNMAKKKGWTITGNRYKNRICPNHQKEETMATQLTKPKDQPVPSEAARAKRREVFFEIDNAYDGKAYKSGFSDAIIADKCKVSLNMVQVIREENFGPAGPDSRVVELNNLINSMEARITQLEETGMKAYENAEKAAQDCRRDLASLKDRLNKLEGLL